jgi:hypothetical protein
MLAITNANKSRWLRYKVTCQRHAESRLHTSKGIGELNGRATYSTTSPQYGPAYYVPDADIRLFSPQTYVNSQPEGGSASMHLRKASQNLLLTTSTSSFPYNPETIYRWCSSIAISILQDSLGYMNLTTNEKELTKLQTLLSENNHNLSRNRRGDLAVALPTITMQDSGGSRI